MNLAIQRFKVYSKLILIILFVLFVILMMVMNSKNQVTVWFFASFEEINVLWLMFVTALFAVLAWITLRFAFGVVKDLKALKTHETEVANKKRQDELMKRLDHEETKDAGGAKGVGGLSAGHQASENKNAGAGE